MRISFWKYERHSLPNLLTLIIGLFLVGLWTLNRLGIFHRLPDWLHSLVAGATFIAFYLLFVMYNFLLNLGFVSNRPSSLATKIIIMF